MWHPISSKLISALFNTSEYTGKPLCRLQILFPFQIILKKEQKLWEEIIRIESKFYVSQFFYLGQFDLRRNAALWDFHCPLKVALMVYRKLSLLIQKVLILMKSMYLFYLWLLEFFVVRSNKKLPSPRLQRFIHVFF